MTRISLIEAYDNKSVIKQIADLFRFKQDKLSPVNAGTNIIISEDSSGVPVISASSTIGTAWGNIGGDLADQTDLQTALDNKQTASVNIRNILIGTDYTPSDTLGSDGDLYIYKP